jgi:hypothetical protein
MSIALFAEVKALREQVAKLAAIIAQLEQRILDMEAPHPMDAEPPRRGPGRPRKEAAQ